jgi:copper(I)-binding protein
MNRFATFAGAAIVAATLGLHGLRAETYSVGTIEISDIWARATPGGSTVGAGYLRITNKGSQPDRLMGGSLVAAARFEVHTTSIENGVARMRPVEGLEIKPGETVELSPGGTHVMFMGLKAPLKQGQRVHGTLVFEKAGKIEVDFAVQGVGAGAPSGGHTGH